MVQAVVELGEITLTWGLFSLAVVNEGSESEEMARRNAWSSAGLRTAVLVRDDHGQDALGAYYADLGRRVHEVGEPLDAADTVKAAVAAAGLSTDLVDAALADDATWDTVRAEHDDLVANTASFGVPTMILDGGAGPAIFGPVISNPPDDEDAVELWRHVRWLARYDNFSELKRDRTVDPDLELWRQLKAQQAADR